MSAAGRAAEKDVSHILLERTDHLSDTIYKYQKRKHVMAEPPVEKLPLRSDMPFEAGTREEVLGVWDKQVEDLGVNVRYNADVTAISGEKGNFEITINGSETLHAEFVVLSIGLQGNINKLRIDGADWSGVQYQLDDPDEYNGETIAIIGNGDAGIENALALADHNNVIILNRGDDFPRAKDANRRAIESAIEDGRITCHNHSDTKAISPGALTVELPSSEITINVDRLIARIGASPPRRFLESIGIEFPNENPHAIPEISEHYESNVSGLYLVGALGGYQLIKQALNQGYDVIEFILGNPIETVQDAILREKFSVVWPNDRQVDEVIDQMRRDVPLLSGLTSLQLKDFLNEANIHSLSPGSTVFEQDDYGSSLYAVLEGDLEILVDLGNGVVKTVSKTVGDFVGEVGLIAGRRRSATVKTTGTDTCVLIEAPRNAMLTLINSVDSVREVITQSSIRTQISIILSQGLDPKIVEEALQGSEILSFKSGDNLFKEGDEEDGLYLIRKGSVTVSRTVNGREIILAYVPTGQYVGEMAVLSNAPRSATVTAAITTEAIRLPSQGFQQLLASNDDLRTEVESTILQRTAVSQKMVNEPDAGGIIEYLVEQGIGEATDMLLIDESLCVQCDNCVKACADTHGGVSRLNREAGPTVASLHVPTACRHCEHPHCMSDCPPNAINRATDGEVIINPDICIGCERCSINCPYGVIQMAPRSPPPKTGIFSWLLFGAGSEPGTGLNKPAVDKQENAQKVAVKCDLCAEISGGPSCVRSCPTGAAIRGGPEKFFAAVNSNLK